MVGDDIDGSYDVGLWEGGSDIVGESVELSPRPRCGDRVVFF